MRKKIGLACALIFVLLFTTLSIAQGALNQTTQEAKSISKHYQKFSGKNFIDDMSKTLGIDSQVLKQELKAGKTLKEIAASRGMDESSLRKKLESQINERIAQSIKEGKISQEKAESIQKKLPEKLTQLVNKKWDRKSDCGHKGQGHKKELFKGVHDQIELSLKMNSEELKAEFMSGKSLAQIAQEKNVDTKVLVSSIQKTVEQNLEQLVKDHKISAEQAEKIRQKLPVRIEKMLQRVHKEQK